PLVAMRSPLGIVLDEQAREALQGRLKAMLSRPEDARRAERAWRSIENRHVSMAPALALEERVAWLVATGASDVEIEDALAPALAALESGDRPGLLRWARFAWARLPEPARVTRAGWLLGHVGGGARSRPRLRQGARPDRLEALDVATTLAG